jgi:hypothetical protein
MPVTLAQAALATQDALQRGVIDEFRKSSFLLDNLAFDPCVNPSGGGSTMTYGYFRLTTEASAAFRNVNEEYTPQEAQKTKYTAELKIFGGSFQIDRILTGQGTGEGLFSELELQISQKVKSGRALFHDTVINGDTAVNAKAFDGLDKAITGSDTEYNTGAVIDLSTSALIDTNYKAFIDSLELWLSLLDATPTALMMNRYMKARIAGVARRAGYFSQTEDAFGRKVDTYNGIPLVDMGAKPASTSMVVPNVTRDIGGAKTNLTDIYAAELSMEGFHGITAAGREDLVKTYLPDFNQPGAVKLGEVELLAAVVLKRTKAAGVLRNIKVLP